jgi:hypothetical protein
VMVNGVNKPNGNMQRVFAGRKNLSSLVIHKETVVDSSTQEHSLRLSEGWLAMSP